MAQRRHHYEAAFEQYLRDKRIPYVAVDEAKKALLPIGVRGEGGGVHTSALKSFDFVLYGEGTNLLVEVKGRRAPVSGRLENWVTLDDVQSLSRWEGLFGPGFDAAFVFIYWHEAQPADALFEELFKHGDRWYGLRGISVREYARVMKIRSTRWGTMDVPRKVFDHVSAPFSPQGGRLRSCGDSVPIFEVIG